MVSPAASSLGAHSSGLRMAAWPCLGGELTRISGQLLCFVSAGRQGVKSSGRQSQESPASRPHPHGPLPSAGPQASHKESEEALQKRLDEVSRELCRAQSSHASLRADAEKAREQQQQMAGEGGEGPAPSSSPPGRTTQGSGLRAVRGEGELRPPGTWQPSQEDRRRRDDDRLQGPVQGMLSL